MYDALVNEIEEVQRRILASFDALDLKTIAGDDYVTGEIVGKLNSYTSINRPTNFFGTLDKFLDNRALYHFALLDEGKRICLISFSSLPEVYCELLEQLAAEFIEKPGYKKQDLRDLVTSIAKSNPTQRFDVRGKNGDLVAELFTPEEKFIAVDALKAIIPTLDDYETWYEKVKKTLADPKYAKDLQHIYDEASK